MMRARVSWLGLMVSMWAGAAWGQQAPFERFCDEARKAMAEEASDTAAAADRKLMKGELEKAIRWAKSAPPTETAIASRLAGLRVEARATALVAEYDWAAFDRELAPMVHRWAVAVGAPGTDRYVDVFNALEAIKAKGGEGFAQARKFYAENRKAPPAEPWTAEQIEMMAQNRAKERIGSAVSTTCQGIERKLRGVSRTLIKVPPTMDDAALVKRLRGERSDRLEGDRREAQMALELVEVPLAELEARLAKLNDEPRGQGGRWPSRMNPPREDGELAKEFAAAFGKQAPDLVRAKVSLKDGSEATCERVEASEPAPQERRRGGGGGAGTYVVKHRDRAYHVVVGCSCLSPGIYLPEGPDFKLAIEGTRAYLKIRDDSRGVLIVGPNVTLEWSAAPGSPDAPPAEFKLPPELEGTQEGQVFLRWLRTQERSSGPALLEPEIIQELTAAIFDLKRM